MPYKDIDELIKRGIYESEVRNESELLQAKSRVWESIHLPKKKKTVHWGFVTALAACLTLFIISIVLLLKLESQQNELEALQAYVKKEKETLDVQGTIVAIEAEPENEQKPIIVPKTISADKSTETTPITQVRNSDEKIADAKSGDAVLESTPVITVTVPQPEIEIPEISINPLITELIINQEVKEKNLSEASPKTPGKLRIRFGANSNVISQQHSLALNIKL